MIIDPLEDVAGSCLEELVFLSAAAVREESFAVDLDPFLAGCEEGDCHRVGCVVDPAGPGFPGFAHPDLVEAVVLSISAAGVFSYLLSRGSVNLFVLPVPQIA